MNPFELVAEARAEAGKGASRRLRRAGKLPGIVYGAAKAQTPISLNHNDLMHRLEHEAFYSHILTLKLDNAAEKVVLKDLQRHPWKRSVLHIDLQRVNEDETLTMRVPLHFINEEKCVGVKQGGGVISHLATELEVVCLPRDLPEYLEVDMLEVEIGGTVHLGDLEFPEGVRPYALLHGGDERLSIASVHAPKGAASEDETAPEAGESADAAAEAPEKSGKT